MQQAESDLFVMPVHWASVGSAARTSSAINLRRSMLKGPWTRLHESPSSICVTKSGPQLMHMHAGAVKTFADFEHRPFTSICGVKFLTPMSPTRLGPCAALELSGGGFETAADCYLRAAIACASNCMCQSHSSAAVCGLLSMCRAKMQMATEVPHGRIAYCFLC